MDVSSLFDYPTPQAEDAAVSGFLDQADEREWDTLLAAMQTVMLRAGETVFTEGQTDRALERGCSGAAVELRRVRGARGQGTAAGREDQFRSRPDAGPAAAARLRHARLARSWAGRRSPGAGAAGRRGPDQDGPLPVPAAPRCRRLPNQRLRALGCASSGGRACSLTGLPGAALGVTCCSVCCV